MTNATTEAANAVAKQAAATLRALTNIQHHNVAVVLGSGWMPAADRLGHSTAEFPVSDLPGFAPPAVEGHAGRFRSIDADGQPVLVFLGRTHLYEEHGVDAVTHAVRTAHFSGCQTIILTNGCGGLDPAWSPGTPVLIKDQINLTGTSPLHGPHFVDLTNLDSQRLREMCQEIDPQLPEGVYCQFRGPMFETPAEITMVKAIGGTLVGMSTALEAIVARSLGMEILGLSLVTNAAAGMTGEPISHEEVLAAGHAAAARIGDLLARVIRTL